MVTRSTVKSKNRKEIFGLAIQNMLVGQALNMDPNYLEALFTEDIWQQEEYSDLRDLIKLMLTPNYQERPSSHELLDEAEQAGDVHEEGFDSEYNMASEIEDLDIPAAKSNKSFTLSILEELFTMLGNKWLAS